MERRVEREFGRNVTNALVGKVALAGQQQQPVREATVSAGGDLRRPRKRSAREDKRCYDDDDDDGVHASKRRCSEDAACNSAPVEAPCGEALPRPAVPLCDTAGTTATTPSSSSSSSIERCFGEETVAAWDSPGACAELLRAVEDADAAVMAGLRCAAASSAAASETSLAPPTVPLLFSVPDAI